MPQSKNKVKGQTKVARAKSKQHGDRDPAVSVEVLPPGPLTAMDQQAATSRVPDWIENNPFHWRLFTAKQRQFMLTLIEYGGNLKAACWKAHIAHETHRNWLHTNEHYASCFESCLALSTEMLESEAIRRGMTGVDEPVFYKGKKCGAIRRYSDTLLIFLLKGRKPEVYRENFNVTGEIKVKHGIDDEIDQLFKKRMERLAGGSEVSPPVEAPSER